MKFVSLKDVAGEAVSFQEALTRGLAPDKGLYVPEYVPRLSKDAIDQLTKTDRYGVASTMLGPWLDDEISAADLSSIIRKASTFPTPVVKVGDKKILELFHGPTMAFKDVAAQFLAAFMEHFNKKSGKVSTVLVATSGDTGGAIAHGFAGAKNINLVVLYPKDRISRLQREQLRRVAPNVHSLEVNGDFNDCQELVKQAFADRDLSDTFHLTSANSINIGRLLPQMTYYADLYRQMRSENTRVIVPTGNLGNLTAGIFARTMGVPIHRFVAANNANDSLARYLASGTYEPHPTIHTISNAMDVNAPNNLPRFMKLFNDDLGAARAVVQAVRVNDEETIETIKRVYGENGYLLDPHTAVGWRASEMLAGDDEDVIVATASPLKFAEEILDKTGIKVDNSQLLEALQKKPERYHELGNSLRELGDFLHNNIATV